MKGQVISMDFIMTFVVFLFALTIFFFSLEDAITAREPDLDISAELLFNQLDNMPDERYDFLDGSYVDRNKMRDFRQEFVGREGQRKEISLASMDPLSFRNVDYCIYLEDTSGIGYRVGLSDDDNEDNLAIGRGSDNNYYSCGSNPYVDRFDMHCNASATESIVLSKPVFDGKEMMALKVLVCGQR